MASMNSTRLVRSKYFVGPARSAMTFRRDSSPTGDRDRVRGACGLSFSVDAPFIPGEAEIVIVAGGGWNAHAKRGAWAEYQTGELMPLLVAAASSAGDLSRASVRARCCGLTRVSITGRRASTHHSALEELAELGVEVVPERVVDDGDLITCGGVTSGLDLAFWLVARELNDVLAQQISKAMEYKWFRPNHTTVGLTTTVRGESPSPDLAQRAIRNQGPRRPLRRSTPL